ncbi:MAG: lysophospholipid acyltransferase family protein [Candidatus Staskawiczbacteria bacterium]|nr:lysophospholipid acyltransferase family protein [Candidatus Staskawiczbacteria bacterium]
MSFLEAAGILFFAYPAGLVVAVWFALGRLLGRIVVLHEERLPENVENTIIPFNHPSVIDPFLVAGLLSKYYLPHPLKQAPLIAADRKHFYDNKLLLVFRSAMYPVDRGNKGREAFSILGMRKTKRPLMIGPEGGRTFKCEAGNWMYCEKGNDSNGGRIRPLKGGAGLLVQKMGATVLPIAIVGSHTVVPNSKKQLWTHFNFWGKVTIVVGEPTRFDPNLPKEEVTQQLAVKLLSLINEAL